MFTSELARRLTPDVETAIRQAMGDDTAAVIDASLVDAVASSTSRPAGLLNGRVSAHGNDKLHIHAGVRLARPMQPLRERVIEHAAAQDQLCRHNNEPPASRGRNAEASFHGEKRAITSRSTGC